MKFRIQSTEITVKSVISKRTGKGYDFHEQAAFIEVNGEVRRVVLNLERGEEAYKPGVYELDEKSFSVDQYGQLQVRPKLRAIAASTSALKAG